MTKLADEYADIKARLEEIQLERVEAVAGKSVSADVPEAKPIDWPTMYGVYQAPDDFMGYKDWADYDDRGTAKFAPRFKLIPMVKTHLVPSR